MENPTHEKIIHLLKEKGPSLPIQIARYLQISSLFVSAYLSELVNEKRIKMSSLKVGGSQLFFLEGQEELLEPNTKYLHPKEQEAFKLLKSSKVLKDSEQEPAIRVALRAIKDFAIGFQKDEEIYWRYILVPEEEVKQIFNPKQIPEGTKIKIPEETKIIEPKIEAKKEEQLTQISSIQPIPLQKPEKTKEEKPKQEKKARQKPAKEEKPAFTNPLAIIPAPEKKEKPKSEFVLKVILFLNKKYKIIEEKFHKPKEYSCITEISSDLGPISFLTLAKDKKSISDSDLKDFLATAQSLPLPALFISQGKPSKKAIEYAKQYNSILKIQELP
jgi:hypothetical protein